MDSAHSLDIIEFLRTQERAAYERWRATPCGETDLLLARHAAWKYAEKLYDAELLHRAAVVGRAA